MLMRGPVCSFWPRVCVVGAQVRSAMIFSSTCKGCAQLAAVLRELGLPCAELHSGEGGGKAAS